MNCNEVELIVLALARHQLMDAGANEAALAHAESCLSCSARLASERFWNAGARAVVADLATKDAPDRVEEALLAAFRNQAVAVGARTVITGPFATNTWSSFWKPAAVAASILALVSTMATFWLYSKSSLNESNGAVAGISAPVLPEPPAVQGEPGSDNENVLANSPPPRRLSRRVVRPKTIRPEEVSEFYPLIEGEDLDSSEFIQVVRVELPASALSAAGFSVSPEIATLPVKADVLLGHDGLARAVRFVR